MAHPCGFCKGGVFLPPFFQFLAKQGGACLRWEEGGSKRGAGEGELREDYPHLTTEDIRAAVAYGAASVALDADATTNLV